MAVIPQITNPASSRNFTSSSTPAGYRGSGEGFDVLELAKPLNVRSNNNQKDNTGNNSVSETRDFIPMSVKIAKNPTMAADSLKQLINGDLLNLAKANGYTELQGELKSLMETIFMKPENIVKEILLQEKSNTLFSGKELFNLLRELISTDGVKNALHGKSAEAILNMLRQETPLVNNPHLLPINNKPISSEDSIIDNFRTAVGNLLKAINYAENKNEILSALSANMKFLSKYFSPNKLLSEGFADLASKWMGTEAAANFELYKNQTLNLLGNASESLLNSDHTQVLMPLIIHNLSRYNANHDMLPNYFAELLNFIGSSDTKEKLNSAFDKFFNGLLQKGSDDSSYKYNNTTNSSINQVLDANFYKENQISRYLNEKSSNEEYLETLNLDSDLLNAPVRSYFLGKIDGKTAINEILKWLMAEPEMKEMLSGEINQLNDMESLVNYLNDVLKSMPDVEARRSIFENLVDIINNMAEKGELPAKPNANMVQKDNTQPVIKNLIEFIEKNIDHAAIKTINNYNASNLLQSLINAPGVLTPLAHYIIPIDIDGMRAFGELWVDNDEEHSSKEGDRERQYHLFLTFDINEIGRFEIDMKSSGENVYLSILHPDSFKEKVDGIIKKVNRLIASNGYVTRGFVSGVLKKPHNLTEVFPNIIEKRTGFNVKA